MAAGINHSVIFGQVELGQIILDQIVEAALGSRPAGVAFLVGAADRRDEFDTFRVVGGQFGQFGIVGQFILIAGPQQHIEIVAPAALAQVFPDDAEVGADAGYRSQHQVVMHLFVQGKNALGPGTQGHGIAHLHPPHLGGQLALRHQFDENFQLLLVGRGDDGIGPFHPFLAQGAILARLEPERALLGGQFNHHQVVGDVPAVHQFGLGQAVGAVLGAVLGGSRVAAGGHFSLLDKLGQSCWQGYFRFPGRPGAGQGFSPRPVSLPGPAGCPSPAFWP